MNRLRTDDQVVVLAGKDKGKRGKIIKILSNDKVLVESVNLVKKHEKPNPGQGITGGIVEKAMPIHRSNIAILNKDTNEKDKVGIRTLEDGKRVRFYKSTNEVVDL